ncbi:hypothetical protein L1887_54155 [Cichorium endivia]|nr:hypothetical protein L1887_54155 [Cichorium endivia]
MTAFLHAMLATCTILNDMCDIRTSVVSQGRVRDPASSPGVHRQTLHTNFAPCVAGAAEAAEALSVISRCSYTHEVEERGVGMGFGPGVPAPPARNPRWVELGSSATLSGRELTFSPLLYIPSPSTRTWPPLSFSKAPAHLLQTSDPSHLPATLPPA